MRRERGDAEELPDVAVWLQGSETPGAVIAESGGRREDRQKMILEGWRDAVWSGRYLGVRYDCASPSVAQWITRLAKKVGLTDSDFTAGVQTTAEQIAALSPAAPDDDESATEGATPSRESEPTPDQELQTAPEPSPPPADASEPPPVPKPETAEATAERDAPEPESAEPATARERRYRQILGMDEPTPRRQWHR